mgnify:CR=1 FL=1
MPSTGQVTITGRDYHELVNPGLEVGVLLDASAQHAGRTGREILTIAADTMGLPRRRVDESALPSAAGCRAPRSAFPIRSSST